MSSSRAAEVQIGQYEEQYRVLVSLWAAENSVKTSKLQMLGVINAILVAAWPLGGSQLALAGVGFLVSVAWSFSLGRTLAFQQHRRSQMSALHKKFPDHPLFTTCEDEPPRHILGCLRSTHILLGTCLLGATAWLMVLVWLAAG